jgi:hypothetical protein
MRDTIESRPDQPIVVCPADHDIGAVSNACQLFGAFVLAFEDAGLDAVLSTIKEALHGRLAARRDAIVDCWAALDRARALGWLGATGDDAGEPALDVEMASHYALASNGGSTCWCRAGSSSSPRRRRSPRARRGRTRARAGVRRGGASARPSAPRCSRTSGCRWRRRTGGSDAAALCAGGLDEHVYISVYLLQYYLVRFYYVAAFQSISCCSIHSAPFCSQQHTHSRTDSRRT